MAKPDEIGIPVDIVIKLFDTLSDSSKLTQDQLRGLTDSMTRLVVSSETRRCEESHKELKAEIIDTSDDTLEELKKINMVITENTQELKSMKKVVKITFTLLISLLGILGMIAIIIEHFIKS